MSMKILREKVLRSREAPHRDIKQTCRKRSYNMKLD
jgi:hypothetical protein